MSADRPDDPYRTRPNPGDPERAVAEAPTSQAHPAAVAAGPPIPPTAWRRTFSGLRAAAATAGVVALLGVPLGLLWLLIAPEVPMVKAAQGAITVDSQPEEFVAADGWFALLGLAFGASAAVGTWLLLRRRRGPLGLLAVTVGALFAGLAGAWVADGISAAEYHRLRDAAAIGERFDMPPRLRSGGVDGRVPLPYGALLLPAFGAAVTYTLLAGWARDADLGTAASSWDSPAPRTPPAPPAPPAGGAAGPAHG
ncbi:MAG TPA: DUF2567 domain-containing protein [Micromonosporaceae bacterium]